MLPHPLANLLPLILADIDRHTGLVLTPMTLEVQPQLQVINRRNVLTSDRTLGGLDGEGKNPVGLVRDIFLMGNTGVHHELGQRVHLVPANVTDVVAAVSRVAPWCPPSLF